MRVSVVIATRDRAAYVARALASLEAQIDAPPFEAIVVDNGSSDGTKAVVEAAAGRG
jgi:glycosyltransferase involved in cell wall biosynthesis